MLTQATIPAALVSIWLAVGPQQLDREEARQAQQLAKVVITTRLSSTTVWRRSTSSLDDGAAAEEDSQQYVLPGGGFYIQRGGTHREPSVYATSKAVIALFGCLSNGDELVERFQPTGEYAGFTPDPSDDTSQLAALVGGVLMPCPSDQATLSAELILRLYDVCEGNVLLLLSELQGDFSFVLFDSDRRVAFAARDPTGGEPIYYTVDDGGGVVITNSTDHVAGGALEDVELGDTLWQVFVWRWFYFHTPPSRLFPRGISWRESGCSSLRSRRSSLHCASAMVTMCFWLVLSHIDDDATNITHNSQYWLLAICRCQSSLHMPL